MVTLCPFCDRVMFAPPARFSVPVETLAVVPDVFPAITIAGLGTYEPVTVPPLTDKEMPFALPYETPMIEIDAVSCDMVIFLPPPMNRVPLVTFAIVPVVFVPIPLKACIPCV